VFSFSHKKARQTQSFCLRMMKNHQRQHKGKPHSQDAAISVEDAIIIIRDLNLCGAHCTRKYRSNMDSNLLIYYNAKIISQSVLKKTVSNFVYIGRSNYNMSLTKKTLLYLLNSCKGATIFYRLRCACAQLSTMQRNFI
jgi:hypothetical protein